MSEMNAKTLIGPATDPFLLFTEWMNEAKAHPHIKEAIAMNVASISEDGSLHSRIVLCKEWSQEGFVFFTNYLSRKGKDLSRNHNIAANFYWDPLFRQVKISGTAAKIARSRSEAYWQTRPRESQLSQWISKQSETVGSREQMEEERHRAEVQFKNQKVPCPPHWGGYVIGPKQIEFWIGEHGRFHRRYLFTRQNSSWTFNLLYP